MVYDVRYNDVTLSARYLEDSGLWCWEIHEAATGRFVDSSWSSDWMAYSSLEEAQAAGFRRLARRATPPRAA